jgi:hypothetical protein
MERVEGFPLPRGRLDVQPATRRGLIGLILFLAAFQMGPACQPAPNVRPGVGSQLFTSPQTNPIALSSDGQSVYVANTTAGQITVLDANAPYAVIGVLPVGLDPVGIAVKPKAQPSDDEILLVTNHLSDSISVVNLSAAAVTQTLQDLDGNGVTTTDEPVGVAFDGPTRAFVTLDNPNQVIGIEFDGSGNATISEDRATVTAQAPRAVTVSNGRVYVAAFESGNQSEFPSCGPTDPADYDPNGHGGDGTGCLFPTTLTNVIAFATNPNIGGEVVHNPSIPDRDLFVYDAADFFDANGTPQSVSPVDVVEGLGTLLYGATAVGDTVYVTHTDARNKLDGLDALANRMFENRLAIVSCPGGSCGAPTIVDLESGGANPFGVSVPTPYGVRAADDGQVLVVSVAGSDGQPGDPGDPSTPSFTIPGLVTLDASGNVLGHVATGAIPQGVALRSDGLGAAQTAFVLNTVDSTVSVVDVSTPGAPSVLATVTAGDDPTPAGVRAGRIAFSSARASTSGTFSCESCHPNANIDQVDWTINSTLGPQDACDPGTESCPEPRSTMPIRGLRDTLPLHWVGNLADPFAGVGVGGGEDPVAPDCDISVVGETGCVRHLVDASLSGVMCDPSGGCPTGPSTQAGAFTSQERDDLSAFLVAVAFPPGPARRVDDVLSSTAATGVNDFFLDNGGIGGMLGGAAATCANPAGGCHALPLTVSTNSSVVGGFDAPSIRGLWDRHITFSNGFTSSYGNLSAAGFDPAPGGMSELGSLSATFPNLFTLAYGVPVTGIWAFINEMSVGLPGATGRQVDLTPGNRFDADTTAALNALIAVADEGRVTLTATGLLLDLRYDPDTDQWIPPTGASMTTDALRDHAVNNAQTNVVTAHLPQGMSIGGADRQPLLWATTRPDLNGGSPTMTLNARYVHPAATVLVDGVSCATCSISTTFVSVDVTISPLPANGLHVVQLLNPTSYASNEFPFCVGGGCNPGF